MKKIFLASALLLLSGCSKEPSNFLDKEFVESNVMVYSAFNDSNISFDLKISDVLDKDDFCNGFYYEGNYNDFQKEFENNEFFYENLEGNTRFFKDGQFYLLQLIEQYDNCCYCKILSEYALYSNYVLDEATYRLKVPFPRINQRENFLGLSKHSKFSKDYYAYLIKYYEKINIFETTITDDYIYIANISNNDKIIDLKIVNGTDCIYFETVEK